MIPYVIGIAGGTASGKTSFVRELKEIFGESLTVLSFDDYYKDLSNLTYQQRTKINFDHPDAFDLDLLAEHLTTLKLGQSVVKPVYDFTQHNRKKDWESLEPSKIIVVDGLFTLAIENIACQCDLKLYMDVSSDLRFIRRLERDIVERGRSLTSVKEQYLTTVRPMHELFVEPSKRKADLVVLNDVDYHVGLDVIVSKIWSKLH